MAPRAVYSPADDRVLVTTLMDQAQQGNQSENGFKAAAYVAAATALEGSELVSGGKEKSSQSCRDRFISLKKDYSIVNTLRGLSGFGWDAEQHLVIAPDDVWEKYLQAHPKAGKWRKVAFPLFDDMAALVDGTAATGAGAFHPGQAVPAAAPNAAAAAAPNATATPGTPAAHAADSSDSSDEDDVLPPATPTPAHPAAVVTAAATGGAASVKRDRKRNGRVTAADATLDLAQALDGIRDALSQQEANHDGVPPSPKRRKTAIQTLASDEGVDLTPRRKVKLITRFRKETAIADTYMALIGDDILRSGYLREELESAE